MVECVARHGFRVKSHERCALICSCPAHVEIHSNTSVKFVRTCVTEIPSIDISFRSNWRCIRFAAFANGVSIHTEDFDDTQLAVEKDRVYGLLTHPSVSVVPPILAESEVNPATGKDWMPLQVAEFLPVIPNPAKILCIGGA